MEDAWSDKLRLITFVEDLLDLSVFLGHRVKVAMRHDVVDVLSSLCDF